ncbi:RNA exonuclease 1 homolog isoform X1 [Alligator mississippiensis]|nr:RNA exonuclease 1 homolog isoform X1 [Alligator mississippiensis]XP_014451809.1 RNA exonuclease 1 homolog isoform X1 [Alligator mississippiensis]XP_019346316.1 RNA exonuclease 1 homolog isoform X1 [Alligator mississippiensis]XP_019346318.1 RNA exonuclease 1 homolog isoform X1 [Alligator mississippiensis]
MQGLGRTKKQKESVKTEFKDEQKRFLQHNLKDEMSKNNLFLIPKDLKGNDFSSDQDDQCNPPQVLKQPAVSSSKHSNHAYPFASSKYVLDHSCPATDLEYDPLLNYSAGLLSSSLAKEDENDKQQFQQMEASPCDNQQMFLETVFENKHGSPKKRARSSSPIKLEINLQESDDDDVLVIDVPPLTLTKKPKISRSYKKLEWEEKCAFVTLADNLQNRDRAEECKYAEEKRTLGSGGLQKDNEGLGNTEETLKMSSKTQSTNFLDVKSDILKVSNNLQEHSNTLTNSTENNMPSLYHTVVGMQKETLNTGSTQTEIPVKTSNVEEHTNYNFPSTQSMVQRSWCSEDSLKDKSAVNRGIPKKLSENTNEALRSWENGRHKLLDNISSHPSDKLNLFKETGPDTGVLIKNFKEGSDSCRIQANSKESEIIVLDSSSEEMDYSEEDSSVSESDDPTEECRRIFNEFVESEALKEKMANQAHGINTEAEALDSKTNTGFGQKKRIAHTAKFDVQTSKEIIVPFKAPPPQQANARILQVQHQAAQITAAVKSGQAFVAATSGQKKNVSGSSMTQSQSVGSMVSLNMLEVQPVATSQLNVVLQGNAVMGMPYRSSTLSVKRTAPMPMKVSTRRRPSVIPESGSKVSHDTRQRYVNFFVEEYMKICRTVNEAFDKALAEEKAIYDRCGSKNMYLNITVNTLKKLRDHGSLSSNGQASGSRSTNANGSGKSEEKNDLTGIVLYRLLKDYILTDEQLNVNHFPQPNPEKPGSAVLNGVTKTAVSDPCKRTCCRCGKIYAVTSSGKHIRKEECNYHFGRVQRHKVPGGMESRYSCCEGVVGSPGCQVVKLHVHDGRKENLEGFMKTFIKPPPPDGNHGVYALDCEMCYTTQGLELTRVTVVDPDLQVAYNTFVKPDNDIIDYNTRFSGVTEEDLKNTTTTIRDVQAILLNLFSAATILIGHSLESDLYAVKLFHNTVVDTSIVFPHRLGLPHKRALKNLTADYLRRIIQDDVGGHDSSEDAAACMELILWKVKEDNKGRKW